MAGAVQSEEALAAKFAAVLPHLDERQRRLVMGAEARALGHGGIKTVARAAGVERGDRVSGAWTSSRRAENRWGARANRRWPQAGDARPIRVWVRPLLALVEPGVAG